MKKRRIHGLRAAAIVLAAVLALGAGSFAAPRAQAVSVVDESGRGAGYTSVLYDSSSGLPTSDANAIVQSSEGFIWIGSYSGLIRYDGNTFQRYDSSSGVSSVVSLFVDSQERLWIGTNDSGAAVLQDEVFTFFDRSSGLRSSSVHSITEDPQGNILIATTMGMAYVDGENVLHVIDDPQINREYVCELYCGTDGVVYGVTLSGAFFTIENLRLTGFFSEEQMGYGVINTIYPDPDRPGYVYLGTQESTVIHGDLTQHMRGARTYSVAPQTTVNSIRVANGLVWICADRGIGFLTESGTYVLLKDVPMNSLVDRMMEDYEGNLWFTSSRQGVMKIVENRFTDISKVAGLSTMVVNSTCVHNGNLYIGADTGLTILDESFAPIENSITALMQGVRIRCIREDSAGTLWLCTNSDNGLVRYWPDTDEYRIYNMDSGLASNRARTVLELSDGRLAVATNAGMHLIENGEITALYNNRDGISNMEILCIEEAPDGRIYLGSDGDGIYVVNGRKVSRLGLDDGLHSEVILRLRRDSADPTLYWIVTSNSIAFMRDDKITTVYSFPYSNNFDIYFDQSDRLWVLSSNGIYVVKRDAMLADAVSDYIFYDTECGLPGAATANSYSHLCEDGTLYIASSIGVSSVNIFDDSDDNRQVRLAVPFVYADDQYIPIPESGEITLPATCRRLNIYAYAFTYTLNNPHLRYALEGFDETPVETTKLAMTHPTYTNLAGGKYTFRMALLNSVTGAEDQVLTVTIIKEKTIYEQPLFWALLVVALLALVSGSLWLYYRRKTKLLLKKQAEHKELINQMTSVFASCIDMKDAYTNGHSHRVAKYTAMLAKKLGKTDEEIEKIYNIALLHDIGKISIPDSILNKPGRLTDEEFSVMRSHSQRGSDILKEIKIEPDLEIGAAYHHERVDGRGYPKGLKGEEIPEIARIIAVADTFDAMYSTRPYRKQLPLSFVASEIQKSAGTQLSPEVVNAFMELVNEGAFGPLEPPQEAQAEQPKA